MDIHLFIHFIHRKMQNIQDGIHNKYSISNHQNHKDKERDKKYERIKIKIKKEMKEITVIIIKR